MEMRLFEETRQMGRDGAPAARRMDGQIGDTTMMPASHRKPYVKTHGRHDKKALRNLRRLLCEDSGSVMYEYVILALVIFWERLSHVFWAGILGVGKAFSLDCSGGCY